MNQQATWFELALATTGYLTVMKNGNRMGEF
jgi:hypothetical protein